MSEDALSRGGKTTTLGYFDGCDKFKDSLQKHAMTQEHRAAVEVASCRKDMQRAVATAYSQQEKAVLAVFCTVYFMAKKNLANNFFSDLKLFKFCRYIYMYIQ